MKLSQLSGFSISAALLLTALPCFSQKISNARKKTIGFDPSRYVSIYEDFGKTNQRIPLYTPPNDTRLLSADHESTIVFDLKKALSSEDGDVALNKVYIRAELK